MCDSTECAVETLDAFMERFLVVPWRMVFRQIIGKVEFSWRPYQIKHFLNTIFHPPVPHVKIFGKFLAHF